MGNLAFLIAYIALPIAAFVMVRSLTWVAVGLTASFAFVGAFINFTIDRGTRWDATSLQLALLIAFAAVFVAALFSSPRRTGRRVVPFARQMAAVIAPTLVAFAFVLVSRALAAPGSGAFTGVGFLILRQHAEDNAKWLDFTAQLIAGAPIEQGVPMGGPLQLCVVLVSTLLAVVSLLAFGGVNEVFVASNSVIYLQFALVAIVPFALAPLAEARIAGRQGSEQRRFIPAPAIWVASLVMMAASLAVSGLGHLTLQYVFLVVGLWAGVFLVGTRIRHAYLLTSLAVAVVSVVWFPIMPVSAVILIGCAVMVIVLLARSRRISDVPFVPLALVVATVVLMWTSMASAFVYMADITPTASETGGGGARGVSAGLGVSTLQLLSSQGGTEQVSSILAILAGASAVLGTIFIMRSRPGPQGIAALKRFAPLILIAGYALALSLLGTWYAGTGPEYGALKTTFMATIVVIAVTLPFAILEIGRRGSGRAIVPALAIIAVVYLLTVDTILPRALTLISPQQWPATNADPRGYWWPAEVRNTADQSIAANPIGCAYLPQGAEVPSVLVDGQRAYSCTRLLAGLSGMDSATAGQPLVDWARREWLTNTPAWLDAYPSFLNMPDSVRAKQLILLDVNNRVVGLASVQSLMDKYKPQWAE